MPSFRSTVLAVAVALVTLGQADYVIDPKSVPYSTRQTWCRDEKYTCPLICQQVEPRTTLVNECDPDSLTYGCLCGDGKRPNVSEYTLSLPYFICQEWGNQCVAKCAGVNTCQAACHQEHPCGASDPQKYNATSTGTAKPTASQTDAPNTIYSNSPAGSKGDSKGAAVVVEAGRTYGLAVVLTCLFAGFALL